MGRGVRLRHEGRRPSEILCAGDVPLSVGQHPHGPCPQLCDGRRRGAVQARAGVRRAAPDGLGRLRHAGRERGDGARHPSQGLDLFQHRHDARAAETAGPVAGLVARVRHLRPGVLRQAAGLVPGAVSTRPGLSQGRGRQLGPGRQHRPGQRTGDRRPRLALGRRGREAQAEPVVPAHHRLCRRPDRGPEDPGPLAREGPADAGELDRQVQGRDPVVAHRRGAGLPARLARGRAEPRPRSHRGLHHPPGHPVRGQLPGPGARPSADQGHRRTSAGRGGLHQGLRPDRHQRGRDREGREAGRRSGRSRPPPLRPGQDPARLGGQLRPVHLWLGRHLRLPRPRPARPGLRPQIRSAGDAGGQARRCGHHRDRNRGLCRAGPDLQLRLPGRDGRGGRQGRRHRQGGGRRPGPRRDHLSPARLGRVASALLGLPHPDHPLRILRPGGGSGRSAAGRPARRRDLRRAGQSAGSAPRPGNTSNARRAASMRRARPIRSTPSSIPAGISPASPTRPPTRRSTRPPPIAGWRWISISAGSNTRFCTCSTPAS